jgi:peptidoglycan biosynthesis protein MviN/MurJ (putative lipid II flippase)
MSKRRSNIEALGLVAGFGLWSLAFVLIYGAHGLACGVGVRPGHWDGVTRAALIGLWLAALAAHLWLIWWLRRRWRAADEPSIRFVRLVSLTLALAALPASLWTYLPVATLTICS